MSRTYAFSTNSRDTIIEYIVARSSHTRRCAGVPLCSFTSYLLVHSVKAMKPHRGISKMVQFEGSLQTGEHMETVERAHAMTSKVSLL